MYGTVRTERSVDDHSLSAQLCTAQRHFSTATYELAAHRRSHRHGRRLRCRRASRPGSGFDEQRSLDFGIASACLKHSIPEISTGARRPGRSPARGPGIRRPAMIESLLRRSR